MIEEKWTASGTWVGQYQITHWDRENILENKKLKPLKFYENYI